MVRPIVCLILSIATVAFITACCFGFGDPKAPISVENKTDQALNIFINDIPFGELKPGAVLSTGYGLLWQEEYRVEAKDSSGWLVVSGIVSIHDISSEFRKQDWRIVITANEVRVPKSD